MNISYISRRLLVGVCSRLWGFYLDECRICLSVVNMVCVIIICAIICFQTLGFLSPFHLMHGKKNVSGLVSFSVNFILFLMVLVVCWLWWWVSDLVVIVVLVIICWYPLVYIFIISSVLQSLLLLFAVLLQFVDDFRGFAFRISRLFLRP